MGHPDQASVPGPVKEYARIGQDGQRFRPHEGNVADLDTSTQFGVPSLAGFFRHIDTGYASGSGADEILILSGRKYDLDESILERNLSLFRLEGPGRYRSYPLSRVPDGPGRSCRDCPGGR